MYRVIIGIGLAVLLLGGAVIGYAVYNLIQPVPGACQADGTGCGAPPGTPRT